MILQYCVISQLRYSKIIPKLTLESESKWEKTIVKD
jgi:hypothetical protein